MRGFLRLPVEEPPPDHTTISRTRRAIDLETHRAVFTWVQIRLVAGLLKGKTVAVDATKRKKKTSNRDWKYPGDPDAKIAQMKDGRTHLAHKAEHAVDLETGALVAVTLQDADQSRKRCGR